MKRRRKRKQALIISQPYGAGARHRGMAKLLSLAPAAFMFAACTTPGRVPGTAWNDLDFDFYAGVKPEQKF